MAPRRCPNCKKPVPADGDHRPFCSPRCKDIDLGRWLNEEYRISRPLLADDLAGDTFELEGSEAGDLDPRH